ncbi:MAG: SidA/IucD/PvdA family monooxygenase [Leptospirales bacterium]
MNDSEFDYDVVGVGLGPFNLSLAALLEEAGTRAGASSADSREPSRDRRPPRALFLEARRRFDWHPGMILPGTTLQVPFLADLVTMAAPTSRFSFLNYLHEHGRLYHFYFYENFKIFRKENNLNCRWVSERLSSNRFGARVTDVRRETRTDAEAGLEYEAYRIFFTDEGSGRVDSVSAKHVVLGYGTRPTMPPCAREVRGPGVFHTAQFAANRAHLKRARRVVVIGGGQSAGECVLDILRTQRDTELHWYTRGQGFLPMEYSKLGLEFFSPEYIDYFHALPRETRDRLRAGQDLFYKGISADTIAEIYDELYERSLDPGASQPLLMAGVELRDVRAVGEAVARQDGEGAHDYLLELRHGEQQTVFADSADVLVLGTGYEHALPAFLDNLTSGLALDEHGRLQISRDYRALGKANAPGESGAGPTNIFVQNGEIHTHGIGAPDLGLGAYRAATIANSLLGREQYRIRENNVFQRFGIRQSPKTESFARRPDLVSAENQGSKL